MQEPLFLLQGIHPIVPPKHPQKQATIQEPRPSDLWRNHPKTIRQVQEAEVSTQKIGHLYPGKDLYSETTYGRISLQGIASRIEIKCLPSFLNLRTIPTTPI